MDTSVILPRILDAALSPSDCPWPLVRAHVRLAAADFSLGAACAVHMGVLTAICDRSSRENGIQHLPFPDHAGASLDRAGVRRLYDARQRPDGHARSNRSGEILEHAGSMDRAGDRRDIPGRSGAATPLSWPDLIRYLV